MKKTIFFILLFSLLGCKTYDSVDCHPDSRYFYNRVTRILNENDIKFKYRKLKQIRVSQLSRGQGFYDENQKVVYLNRVVKDQHLWPMYLDVITLTLAHEMAHSQGIMHNSDRKSLMMDSIYLYLPDLIRSEPIDSIIVKAFRNGN